MRHIWHLIRSLTERYAIVYTFNLCCNGLKDKHTVDGCWKQNLCNIPDCVGKHHTLFLGKARLRTHSYSDLDKLRRHLFNLYYNLFYLKI